MITAFVLIKQRPITSFCVARIGYLCVFTNILVSTFLKYPTFLRDYVSSRDIYRAIKEIKGILKLLLKRVQLKTVFIRHKRLTLMSCDEMVSDSMTFITLSYVCCSFISLWMLEFSLNVKSGCESNSVTIFFV